MDGLLMDDNQLRRLADEKGIPRDILEKDYALTNLLSVISEFPKLSLIVFKGGTALKKIHFEEFRFSEDLDFTCLEDVSDEFINFIKDKMKNLDVKFTEISDLEKKPNSVRFKVKYTMANGSPASVRVDMSLRRDIIKDSSNMPVLHFYDTFPNTFEVPVMATEEIMAEKIRAIIYSRHPRHLHDVWYLNNHQVSLNPEMIKTKIKTAYNEKFVLSVFSERIDEKKEEWIKDLEPLMPNDPPPFDVVSKQVLEIVTEAMK